MSSSADHPNNSTDNAFTLVELLVGVVILSIIIIAGISLVLSSLRTGSRLEAFLRLQSRWSLFQYLLNNEIQESIAASTGTGSISLSIPYGNPASCTTSISYSLSAGTISRIGPGVMSDGSLNLPSSCTTVSATTETLLTSVTTFTTSMATSSSQTVYYSLSFTDPTGVTFSNKSTGSTASSRIIN